ncbi:hypothetical protein AC626_16790 [Pseudoalteromonas rubra]|uniref:Uncharacterized protein n=1 Tax=Pseudoalteromonas rubra TaxID=43658 RepID=A0A0L0ERD8_9GAMM|nr:hypothetical protein AC626_16790 [Pseudoalteromonas rubra]
MWCSSRSRLAHVRDDGAVVRFIFIQKLLHVAQVEPDSLASGMTELFVRFAFNEAQLRAVQVDPVLHASGMTNKRKCMKQD